MSHRSAKFIAAIFASILAGTSFAAVAQDAAKDAANKDAAKENGAKTADTCLTRPKGPLPPGGHWYYRTDHTAKRNCWYIGEAKNKAARAASKESSSPPAASDSASAEATTAVSPQLSINSRRSIADARAELTAPQARVEDLIEPQSTGAVPAAGIANSPRTAVPDSPAPSSIASRWPESSGVSPSGSPRLAAAEPSQSLQTQNPQTQLQTQNLQTQSLQTQSVQANAAAAPQPAAPPVALAAADASPERRSASMQMLLLVMAGALALAGITASLVYRFGRAQAIPVEARSDRRAIWDPIPTERTSPSMFPDEDTPIWRSNNQRDAAPRDVPRDPRAADDPERRVTEMLARLARSAHS